MVGISGEIASLLAHLLPGFLTAWIFHGLTAHRRNSPFERAVQALIFTAVIHAAVVIIEWLLLQIGQSKWASFGSWSKDVAFVWSILVAIVLGHLLSLFANKNWYHAMLYKWGVTEKTSYPSEWFSAFHRHKNKILLHLTGERRLFGWPEEWPDHPDAGHFCIADPCWVLDDNTLVPVILDERMLISAKDVEIVEFVKWPYELLDMGSDIDSARKTLVSLQSEEADDEQGKQSAEN